MICPYVKYHLLCPHVDTLSMTKDIHCNDCGLAKKDVLNKRIQRIFKKKKECLTKKY